MLELNEDFAFKNVYIKVKKMELITHCDPSTTHKMSGCVENYVTKVVIVVQIPSYNFVAVDWMQNELGPSQWRASMLKE